MKLESVPWPRSYMQCGDVREQSQAGQAHGGPQEWPYLDVRKGEGHSPQSSD